MPPTLTATQPLDAAGLSPLEELVANANANHPFELVAARGVPVDPQATASLKDDQDRLDKLADVADLPEGSYIADVAVRGINVSFVVFDADGADSRGFVPLEALGDGKRADQAVERGVLGVRPSTGQVLGHGTADPAVAENATGDGTGGTPTTAGDGTGEAGGDGSPTEAELAAQRAAGGQGGQPPAAPEGYEGLNALDAAKYVTDGTEENARAALAFEATREGGARTTVTKAGDARFPAS